MVNGCIKEDNSDCIWENTMLLFKYTDTDGSDIFLRDINSVDAFIFDENKKFVVSRRFESAALHEFAGWKLDLPPGDYHAVCWGNAGANSRLNDFVPSVTTFNESFIQIPSNITTTGDRIYYAPYKTHPHAYSGAQGTIFDPSMTIYRFTVVANKVNVKEMFFVRAHRTINVYIMGYSGNQPATVTGTQLCTEYDFHYTTGNVFRNFTQTAQPVTTPDGPAVLAAFHVGFSEITGATDFIIRQGASGSILETVNLKKFIEDNPSAYGSTIDILIRFSDLGVTVTIPKWGTNTIKPGV
jgi:hypothetical protein